MKYLFVLSLLTVNLHAQESRQKLEAIVSINSGSDNVKGVNKVQEVAGSWFKDLGFKVDLISNPEGESKSGQLLVATLPGELPQFITFIMHADTVFEPSSPFQKITMIDPNKMKGPGVIDNKGGIVVTYYALKDFLTSSKTKYSLRILISPNEEVGSPGFGAVFAKYSDDSFMVLGVEPSHEFGIVESRKGNIWYEIEVQGKEAHAGRHHKDGINACNILAQKITEISKLTDYKKEITFSTGHIEGGQDKFNIVCGSAKAKIDIRTPSLKLRDEIMKKMEKILKGDRISFRVVDDSLPYSANKNSKKFIDLYLKKIKEVEGIKARSHSSGGVGDTNYFSREGIIILDGLGPMGEEIHTENEYILLNTIDSRAKILSSFLKSL